MSLSPLLLALSLASSDAEASDTGRIKYTKIVGATSYPAPVGYAQDNAIKRVWTVLTHPKCEELTLPNGEKVVNVDDNDNPRCIIESTETALVENPAKSLLMRPSFVEENEHPLKAQGQLDREVLPWIDAGGKYEYSNQVEVTAILKRTCAKLGVDQASCGTWVVQKTPTWGEGCAEYAVQMGVGFSGQTLPTPEVSRVHTGGTDFCTTDRDFNIRPRTKFMILSPNGTLHEPKAGEGALMISWHYEL